MHQQIRGGDPTKDSDFGPTSGRTLVTYSLSNEQQNIDIDAGILMEGMDYGDAADPDFPTLLAHPRASLAPVSAAQPTACSRQMVLRQMVR